MKNFKKRILLSACIAVLSLGCVSVAANMNTTAVNASTSLEAEFSNEGQFTVSKYNGAVPFEYVDGAAEGLPTGYSGSVLKITTTSGVAYATLDFSASNIKAANVESIVVRMYSPGYTSADEFASSLMRWYQYEITIEPKSSITNTVTAPIYPAIDARYVPTIFNYTYLLSPASTWSSFGELEIVVNTPFYITDNTIDGFIKTDNGYTYKQNGLPSGELEFTLCTDKNPKFQLYRGGIPIQLIVFIAVVVLLLVVALIVVSVFLIIRKIKYRKQSN